MISEPTLQAILDRAAKGEGLEAILRTMDKAPSMIELKALDGFKARYAAAKALAGINKREFVDKAFGRAVMDVIRDETANDPRALLKLLDALEIGNRKTAQ